MRLKGASFNKEANWWGTPSNLLSVFDREMFCAIDYELSNVSYKIYCTSKELLNVNVAAKDYNLFEIFKQYTNFL